MLGLALIQKQEYPKGIRELEKVCLSLKTCFVFHAHLLICISCTSFDLCFMKGKAQMEWGMLISQVS